MYFKNEDVIVKSVVTSNMTMRRDINYKIFLWTQFPSHLSSIPVLQHDEEQEGNDDTSSDDEANNDNSDTDDDSLFNKHIYQPVPMIKDDYDYLYYVVMINNELCVMEGNPLDPYIKNH